MLVMPGNQWEILGVEVCGIRLEPLEENIQPGLFFGNAAANVGRERKESILQCGAMRLSKEINHLRELQKQSHYYSFGLGKDGGNSKR